MATSDEIDHLKTALDVSQDAVVIVDAAGVARNLNKAAVKLFRLPKSKMLNRHINDLVPCIWSDFNAVLKSGKRKIGGKLEIQGTTVRVDHAPLIRRRNVVGVVGTFQDISGYEMMRTELEMSQRISKELDAIIDSSYDGLWICDHQGKVIRINRASERINTIRADQVIGKTMEELELSGFIDRSVTLEVLSQETSVTLIQQLDNGKQIIVTGNPVFNDKGQLSFVVVNERDITALNRLHKQLEESRALTQGYRSEISRLYSRKHFLSEIVVRDAVMKRLYEKALRVAGVDSIVLIQGESGVGKGLFAKLIHKASNRKDKPFIRVDCGAIPESLIESELFGYEEGAFTGAKVNGKPGRLELAESGTLLLDEVGELPLNVQVKLLRFLEENELIRVGATRAKKIDVRVVAATNRNLEEMVRRGEFRKDLFFRLNVIPLHIPALRERKDDISPLVHRYLENFNGKYKMKKVMHPRALDCLCDYHFPGNIRELSNIIERLVVLNPQDVIEWHHLPADVCAGPPIKKKENPLEWNLPAAVSNMEKDLILRALKIYGTQRKAAGPLGIDQSTLARKIKRYGLRG